jgi:predicted lipase
MDTRNIILLKRNLMNAVMRLFDFMTRPGYREPIESHHPCSMLKSVQLHTESLCLIGI